MKNTNDLFRNEAELGLEQCGKWVVNQIGRIVARMGLLNIVAFVHWQYLTLHHYCRDCHLQNYSLKRIWILQVSFYHNYCNFVSRDHHGFKLDPEMRTWVFIHAVHLT